MRFFVSGKSTDGGFGSLNFAAQNTRVRLAGIIYENSRSQKSALFLMERHFNGNLKLLACRGLVRHQDRIESSPIPLSHKPAIHEHTTVSGKAHHQLQSGILNLFTSNAGWNLDGSAIPASLWTRGWVVHALLRVGECCRFPRRIVQ